MAQAHSHDGHGHNASHGTFKSYIVGFALSVVLTILSFGTVMHGGFEHDTAVALVVAFCVAQLLVQLLFFLHMGTAPEQRENSSVFLFTILIVAIVVAGSLWVLHNMNTNMMPAMQHMPVE